MRVIKPFDMKFKDYDIRVTKIRNYKEKVFDMVNNIYSFDLIIKRNGKLYYHMKNQKLNASNISNFKIDLRIVLLTSNL